jgi:glycosyltransferase involved in cell wall biosynthesis
MSDAPHLSLVIPCYNEQENVPTLLTRVESALNATAKPYEVIIVDDGSTDSTPALLKEAMHKYTCLRVIRLARNGGQSAAFEAGFQAARGEVIATIDADLQNDPEEIPRLLSMLEEHKVDMVTGWRKERQDTPFRRWQSRQANRIRNWITQETVNDSASSLKVYRASAIKGVKLFRGAHRYFPTLVKMRGGTVYETPVKHSQRFAGTAKYGFGNRAFVGIADLFGVRWLKKRYLKYEAKEVERNGTHGTSA